MPSRILVVEDDPQVRTVLLRFLMRQGYEPIAATSGEEALSMVRDRGADLVLLDVNLGLMDGFAVCRALKDDPATALIPVTILTGLSDAASRTRGIEAGADDFITKPFEYAMLQARLRTQLRIKSLVDQLESTEVVILSMARWVEAKDPYTEGHLRRIAGYSEQTALALGLSQEQARVVRYAGILHDIGKIAVNEAILAKPGRLTRVEREELRKHAAHGAEIVAPMRCSAEVGPIILAHHEHWDGSGYPHGTARESIPLGARIVAVVDAWDAMTSDRPYRASLGEEEATRRLRNGAGVQWDPQVVCRFLELVAEHRLAPADLPGITPTLAAMPATTAALPDTGSRAA